MKKFISKISFRLLRRILFFSLLPIICVFAFSHQNANIPEAKKFTQALERSIAIGKKNQQRQMQAAADYYEMGEFREEGYQMAISVDSASRALISYIEEIKRQIAPGIKAYQSWMENEKANHVLQQKTDSFLQITNQLLMETSIRKDFDYKKYLSLEWYSQFKSKEDSNWLLRLFGNLDLNWGICLLNALENDVLLSAAICINRSFFFSTSSWGFQEILCLAVPDHSFILPGQKVTTTFLVGSATPQRGILTITTGKTRRVLKQASYYIAEFVADELGVNKISGTATWRWARDSITSPWQTEFFVAARGCQVQLDKANICYVGVPNPVSLSVPGYPESALSLRVPGADVRKVSDGHFELYFKDVPGETVYAFVDATNKQGRTSAVASLKIIIRNLPQPLASLGRSEGGTISIADVKNADAIHIHQVNDDFKMQYQLLSFEFSVLKKKERALEGPIVAKTFPITEIKQLISQLVPGDKIYIDEVKARDGVGRIVDVRPISYTIE